jgi:hypothetical protein
VQAALRLNQLLGYVAGNLDGFLDRPALRHQTLHLVARGELDALRKALDVQLDHVLHEFPPMPERDFDQEDRLLSIGRSPA